ncbi:MAG: nucleotidyltransferase [Chitinophagaceae bacterium]|nr:nucleotidyltransferase [Chitinophagaceae bacterium]MCW5929051.1 nucleotidyltransferase [Chitinophagaceae bacterium]
MDIFDEVILNFWRALQNNAVRYIMVGGYAANLHGYHRFTGDIDIWLEDTALNRQRLEAAFIECGMDNYPMLDNIQFVPGWADFHLLNGLRLDIIVNMKGLEEYSFDESLEMAAIATIDDVKVPFLHINQLIANKRSVNRPKDQIDVIELEKIKKIMEEK